MIITVNVNCSYDWEKLPEHIQPTEADIRKKIVKPSGNGGWLARINKTGDTHTSITLPESELQSQIIRDCMKDKVCRSRPEALALYLARHIMDHHAHRSWMKDFTVEADSGPEPESFERIVDEHVAAGNLQPEDKADLLKSYSTPATHEHHKDHLHKHFGVPKAELAVAPKAAEAS